MHWTTETCEALDGSMQLEGIDHPVKTLNSTCTCYGARSHGSSGNCSWLGCVQMYVRTFWVDAQIRAKPQISVKQVFPWSTHTYTPFTNSTHCFSERSCMCMCGRYVFFKFWVFLCISLWKIYPLLSAFSPLSLSLSLNYIVFWNVLSVCVCTHTHTHIHTHQ